MACKECKNNAKTFTNGFKGAIKDDFLNVSKNQKSRIEEAAWLESDEGKTLRKKSSLNFSERLLLGVFCFFPLVVGYLTLIYLFIKLF